MNSLSQAIQSVDDAPSATFNINLVDDELDIDLDTTCLLRDVDMKDGSIYITWKEVESPAVLEFRIRTDQIEIDGIQLGFQGDDGLPPGISMNLPFRCQCDAKRQTLKLWLFLPLLQVDSPGPVYSFSLFGRHLKTSKIYLHDPKIYNQGSTGGGGPVEISDRIA